MRIKPAVLSRRNRWGDRPICNLCALVLLYAEAARTMNPTHAFHATSKIFMKTKINIKNFPTLAVLLWAGLLRVNAYVPPPGPMGNPPPFLDQSQPLWGSTAVIYRRSEEHT